jgi:hypothetical protein
VIGKEGVLRVWELSEAVQDQLILLISRVSASIDVW